MTRSELIKKISKKAGIPDPDIKLFFEILLKRLTSMLKIGQAAYVRDFGYFFLLKGKINQSRLNFIDDNIPDTFINFILFSLDKDLKSSIEEGLIFNVPTIEDDDFQIIDTYFSLSIGKPLIPVRGTSSDEFYVPAGGYELRRLIESKVEKIISEAEILTAYENNPPQIILTSQAFNSNRISLEMTEPELKLDEEIPDSFLETGEVKKEETLRIQHVAWDFGADLSKEIEEETISDFQENKKAEPQPNLIDEKNESAEEEEIIIPEEVESTVEEIISEELPNISEQIQITDELKVVSQTQPETESEPLVEETIQGNTNSIETVEEELKISFEKKESTEEILSETPQSEKVEFEYESEKETDENKSSKFFEEIKPEEIREEEEQFEEVESPLPETDVDNPSSKEKINDKFEVVNEPQGKTIVEELPSLSVDENKDAKTEFGEDKELKKIREELYSYQPKKSKVPFLIVLVGSVVIIGMLYFYITQIKNVTTKKSEQKLVLKTDNASIVERDFSVPVSYPYPKKETEEINSVAPIDSEKMEINFVEKPTEPKELVTKKETETTKTEQTVKNNSSQLPVVNYERVAPNIFRYKDYYVVQVAAFRSNSIAENEAAKFRNKGFNAFVEKAEIQGMGTWFRVRIGNFKTLNEAQSFQQKVKL